MLFIANERANAKQLATHLLNQADNDHVTVHEVKGFVSEDVTGAFKEAQAWSSLKVWGNKLVKRVQSQGCCCPQTGDDPVRHVAR